MKKLVLILIGIVIAVVASAQWRVDNGYDAVVKDNQSAYFFVGSLTDLIGEGDSTLTKTVFINTNDEVICDVYVDLDSVSAGAAVPVYFNGKQFPDDTYTGIDTVTYGMTSDTTFTFTSTSAKKYRYWQISIEAPDDSISLSLSKAYFKFWK